MPLFEPSKDFHLDKKTFLNLRWIALFGQLFAIIFVKFVLGFHFPSYFYCLLIVGLGILTNLYLQFNLQKNQLNNFLSTVFLSYDIIQLGSLLYLT